MAEQEIIKINTDDALGFIPKMEEVKLFNLVPENDPILRKQLKEFDFTNPPVDPNEFASTLVETCKNYKGLGLSANQCGFDYRVFVMGANDDFVAFFNPKLISASEEMSHLSEGCLSFPYLFLNITRPTQVQVEYQDFTGETKQATFNGLTARCFLHELDHMDGIVYHDKTKPLALQMGIKKRNKLFSKFKKTQKIINKIKY